VCTTRKPQVAARTWPTKELALLAFGLSALWAGDGLLEGTFSVWDHNGSEVSLSSSGARRQFHYRTPRFDLYGLGVLSGTLLFDGRQVGADYSGVAFTFSKACGALKYPVSGTVSPDQRMVTMTGRLPLVDSNCNVFDYRNDVLIFTLSIPIEAASNVSAAMLEPNAALQTETEYRQFVQRFTTCLDRSQPLDASLLACDEALLYPRVASADRVRLTQRQNSLVQDHEKLSQRSKAFFLKPSDIGYAVGTAFTFLWLMVKHGLETPSATPPQAADQTVVKETPPDDVQPATPWAFTLATADNVPQTGLPSLQTNSNQPEPPLESMSLKLTKFEKKDVWGKLLFVLDARLGLNAEEFDLVKKYRLGRKVIYDSSSRQRRNEKTLSHLERTRDHPALSEGLTVQFLGVGKTLVRLGMALTSAIMGTFYLRVTVDSLFHGVHAECHSLEEIAAAEAAIIEGGRNLKAYLALASTYDGREHIIEL
jgi:hypothetical protein